MFISRARRSVERAEHADKTIDVKVTPREWTIPFARTTDTSMRQTLGQNKEWVFGMNECDVAQEAGRHYIHAKTVGTIDNNWRPLVKHEKVDDADSPFNGWEKHWRP